MRARRRSSAPGCPGVPEAIAERVCTAVARLRGEELYKLPGVGETIAWARALVALGDDADLDGTLGAALKVREDMRARAGAGGARGCLSAQVGGRGRRVARRLGARCGHGERASGMGELLDAHRALAAVDPADPRAGVSGAAGRGLLRARRPGPVRAACRACFGDEPPQQPLIDPVATAVLPRVAVPDPLPGVARPRRPGRAAPVGRERGRAAAREGLRRVLRRRASARAGDPRPGRAPRADAARAADPRRSPAAARTPTSARRCARRCATRASRSSGAGASRSPASARWCWSATSPGRWSPTRGCCSPTPTPASRRASAARRSRSAPG